jgi:hypothetical protein
VESDIIVVDELDVHSRWSGVSYVLRVKDPAIRGRAVDQTETYFSNRSVRTSLMIVLCDWMSAQLSTR